MVVWSSENRFWGVASLWLPALLFLFCVGFVENATLVDIPLPQPQMIANLQLACQCANKYVNVHMHRIELAKETMLPIKKKKQVLMVMA